MDDAYVYFRYIDNFVIHNRGLVWNAGEYVEGFSSPAWVFIMSGLRAIGLNYWTAARAVGLLSFVIFWWLCCLVNRGFIQLNNNRESLNAPLVYLTFNYAVSCYFTSGLEAPLVNLMAAVYAAAILAPLNVPLQLIVGASPLVRQELFIPFVMFCFFVKSRKGSPFPWWSIVSFLSLAGGYEIFRVWYYADLLPNTFYLKDLTWITQGLRYLWDSLLPYQAIPFCAGMALVFEALRRRDGLGRLLWRERLALLLFAAPVFLYVIKIGGDPRHFRYLAFPFIITIFATSGLIERLVAGASRNILRFSKGCLVVLAVACLSNFPRQINQHPLLRIPMRNSNTRVNLITDAAAHRLSINQVTPPWSPSSSPSHVALSYSDSIARFEAESAANQLINRAPLGRRIPRSSLRLGKTLDNLPILSDSWCQNGYLHQAIPIIHNLGLTEPFLAHTKMRSDRPAHKYGLRPLAQDILEMRAEFGFGKGVFDRTIAEDANPPRWVVQNIDSLRLIESKVYNQHNIVENLKLALTPVKQIVP